MAYKEFILDESILDIDSWLPEEAVEEIVQAILYQDNMEEFRIPTVEKREYVTEIPVNDNLKVKSWDSRYVNNIEKNTYRVQELNKKHT